MNCPICHRDYHPREGPTCNSCSEKEELRPHILPCKCDSCRAWDFENPFPIQESSPEKSPKTQALGSGNQPPLRMSYSREEMRDCITTWLAKEYGKPINLSEESKDRWHERCGLLYHFICDHFPSDTATK